MRRDPAAFAFSRRLESPSSLPLFLFVFLAAAFGPPLFAGAQERCPRAADQTTLTGWEAYREGRIARARELFRRALERCPGHPGARTGAGYVDLREGRDAGARVRFEGVIRDDPDNVDALVGLGILAWRRGELGEVSRFFRRVEGLDPGNPQAADYLGRLPEGLGQPPDRPPLVLPDTTVYVARARGDALEVRTPEGWRPLYVKAVNLGAALPGRHPSEFPDSAVYADWIREMAEMEANAVRTYTIHPPHFYRILRSHNAENPERALWLLQGVWAELPPDHDYLDREWEEGFFREMRRVVDLVHGRADIPPRPGHASGHYTADVSAWTLGFILGREWEPFSVVAFDSIHPGFRGWEGEYVGLEGGNAMDAWLAKAVEETVRYEMETYRHQRPVSYTNWPTLDPLDHPVETTVARETAIRESRGEVVEVVPREYDNDAIGLDATLMEPTASFPAGVFATFHAYPYYPDFMVMSPKYAGAGSSLGPSDYFGYLRDLKSHHADMPVVIAEYGVPASIGIAHLQPQGWHHGGHTEAEMAAIDRRLTLEIAESGMAGGGLFAWIDEWFKKNWVVLEFEIPLERNRLWLNRLDAEQHYGMVAMEAPPPVEGKDLGERLGSWRRIPPLYRGDDGLRLRAAADAAYLWLQVEVPEGAPGDLMVGFDLVDPEAGDFRWPGRRGGRLPVGLEFVLDVSAQEVRIVADPSQNPFRLAPVGDEDPDSPPREWSVTDPPPGLFRARAEQRFNLPYLTRTNDDGLYDSLRVIVNRRRFTGDSTEILALGYDRGILRPGPPPDGLWERSPDGRSLEVRIPWMLVNFTDPSQRRLLQSSGGNSGQVLTGPFGTELLEEIGLLLAVKGRDGGWTTWPRSGRVASVATFSWPTWDQPEWTSRRRPVFRAMRETFRLLEGWHPGKALGGPYPWTPEEEGGEPSRGERPGVGQDTVPGREAAARAWNEGKTERAERLYSALLAADSSDTRALHRLALIRAWEEDYRESLRLFDRLLDLEPGNVDARVDRARVLAWRGDLERALEELDGILREHPEHARAVEARAQFQSWAGRLSESLSSYNRLLDITDDPTGVLLARARVLGWAERLEESRAAYDSILAGNPQNLEARLGLARVLSFAGETEEAVALYRSVLRDHPGQVEARRGLARALTWGGRLPEGAEAWRSSLEENPDDLVSWVGLAQNLRWQGRSAAALQALREVPEELRDHPDYREQLRWVRANLAPRGGVSVTREGDSDDNVMTTSSFDASWNPVPRLVLRADGYLREVEQTGIDLARRAWGLTLSVGYQLEPGWNVRAGVGGARNDSEERDTFTSFSLGVTSPGRHSFGGGVSVRRSPLDATARLVETGVEMDLLDVSGRWSPAPGWQVTGSGGVAEFRGAETNTRTHGNVRAQRRVGWGWTLGVGTRYFAFDENLNEGYFDPDFFNLTELSARWLWEPEGWRVLLEGAPGMQKVGSEGDLAAAFRASARLTYRLAPGRELSLSGGYSSAGLQSFSTGEADYRYRAFTLGGRWVF